MDFQPFDLSTLPKRETGPKVDLKAANALLNLIRKNGAATDGTTYETAVKARTAASKATRMLAHVLADGEKATVRTFALDGGGFGFTVYVRSASNGDDADESE